MNRKNRNFEPCPPKVLQWRLGGFRLGSSGVLWRLERCYFDRWHYWENRCNCCYAGWRPTAGEILSLHGYTAQYVKPITGTWRRDAQHIANVTRTFREQLRQRRDAQHIANVTRTFREQLRQRRELEAVASAAKGPQRIRPTYFDYETFTAYCWRDA